MASQRPSPSGARTARGGHSRVLRIIAGEWRGRRLRFPDVPSIRPTPDRVRETLFNWIGARVQGRHGLDLFAGSGALGLEALSRGAASVEFIEQDAAATGALERLLTEWGAPTARVRRTDALSFLAGTPRSFDLVFLDPPFDSGLLVPAAQRLEAGGWVAPHALVYIECAGRAGLPELPRDWQLLRTKRAGEVGYHLLERIPAQPVHDP